MANAWIAPQSSLIDVGVTGILGGINSKFYGGPDANNAGNFITHHIVAIDGAFETGLLDGAILGAGVELCTKNKMIQLIAKEIPKQEDRGRIWIVFGQPHVGISQVHQYI